LNYIIDGTSKIYEANQDCTYKNFFPKNSDLCQYGCEFEFYIDKTIDFNVAIKNIKDKLFQITHSKIIVDMVSTPKYKERNNCMQIKPDISLDDNGIEISVPISSKDGIIHYIQHISSIIDQFGYTNEETGFHIHISTIKNDGNHIDFYRYMLLCHEEKLLTSWKPRNGYSQNVMDVLSKNTKQKSRIIKTKKGTIWNLEKIAPNHIEIKSIGGLNYHKDIDKLIYDFNLYTKYFLEVLNKPTKKHKKLILEHKKPLESLSSEIQQEFKKAVDNTGILPV